MTINNKLLIVITFAAYSQLGYGQEGPTRITRSPRTISTKRPTSGPIIGLRGASQPKNAENKLQTLLEKLDVENIDQAIGAIDGINNGIQSLQDSQEIAQKLLFTAFKNFGNGLGSTKLLNKLENLKENKISNTNDFKELSQLSYDEAFALRSDKAEIVYFIKNFFEPITKSYEEIIATKKEAISALKNNPSQAERIELLQKLLLIIPDYLPRVPSITDFSQSEWIDKVKQGTFNSDSVRLKTK